MDQQKKLGPHKTNVHLGRFCLHADLAMSFSEQRVNMAKVASAHIATGGRISPCSVPRCLHRHGKRKFQAVG